MKRPIFLLLAVIVLLFARLGTGEAISGLAIDMAATTTFPAECGSLVHLQLNHDTSSGGQPLDAPLHIELIDGLNVLVTYQLTSTTHPMNIQNDVIAVHYSFRFRLPTTLSSVKLRLAEYPSVPMIDLELDVTRNCTSGWICGGDLQSATAGLCTRPTDLSLGIVNGSDIAPWSIPVDLRHTAVCNTSILVTPPPSYCVVTAANGAAFLPVEDSFCQVGFKPTAVSLPVGCTSDCNPDACYLKCSATLDSNRWSGFTNCLSSGSCRTCTAARPKKVTKFNCGEEALVSWSGNYLERIPAAATLTISDSSSLQVLQTVQNIDLSKQQITFIWKGRSNKVNMALEYVIDTVKFSFATSPSSPLDVDLPCVPSWRCVDPANPTVEIPCQSELIVAAICTKCTQDFPIPDSYRSCFVGSDPADPSLCATSPSLVSLCECEAECIVGATNNRVPCKETWIMPTQCGKFDSRPPSTRAYLVASHFAASDLLCDPATLDPYHKILCSDSGKISWTRSVDAVLHASNIEACFAEDKVKPTCLNPTLNPTVQEWGACQDESEFCFTDEQLTAGADAQSRCGYIRQLGLSCSFGNIVLSPEILPTYLNFRILPFQDRPALIQYGQAFFETIHPSYTKNRAQSDPNLWSLAPDALLALEQGIDFCRDITSWFSAGFDCQDCEAEVMCSSKPVGSDIPLDWAARDGSVTPCPQIVCPSACENTVIKQNPFCRTPKGTFAVLSLPDSPCNANVADYERQCTANLECESMVVCAPPSDAVSIEQSLLQAVLGDDSGPCTDQSYSDRCYVADSGGTTFSYETCTNHQDAVSVRHSECQVRLKGSGAPLPAGAVSIAPSCDTTLSYTKPQCVDYQGCSPLVENLVVMINNVEVSTSGTISLASAPTVIKFVYDYIGPLPQNAIVEWAHKLHATPKETHLWFKTSPNTMPLSTTSSNTATWTISSADSAAIFNLATLPDSVDLFFRLSVPGQTVLNSPFVLTVNRDKSCTANPTLFKGINEQCVDSSPTAVATLQCINSVGLVSTASTTTGRCSRNLACDSQAPTCENNGFRLVSTDGKSCRDACVCVNAYNPAKNCATCLECPTNRGLINSAGCGCKTCHTGLLQSPDGLCANCAAIATVSITAPSLAFINIVSAPLSEQQVDLEYQLFLRLITIKLSELTSHPIDAMSVLATLTADSTAVLTIRFVGNCISLLSSIPTPEKFAVTETALSVSGDVALTLKNFATNVNSLSLRDSFASYAATSESTITTSVQETKYTPPGSESNSGTSAGVMTAFLASFGFFSLGL